jgi:DNA-binding CsgD family transcriptional regulator
MRAESSLTTDRRAHVQGMVETEMTACASGDLVGRELEVQVLRDLVSRVHERGSALILRGQAGVGKSVLLAAASSEAESHGMEVWRVSSSPAEADLPMAGLHQILRPFLERTHELAPPYREVLLPNIGGDGLAGNGFIVAIATLELFATVTTEAPLLVTVDDAHWLDRETAEVLGFVSRRLGPDRVVLLMTVREGYQTDLLNFGIPELDVRPLDANSSASLLAARHPGLSPELRAQILAEAAGNPLGLVELPVPEQLDAREFGRPDRLPTTKQLCNTFAGHFLHLPLATRALLLVAALDDHAKLNEILAAASLIGDGRDATVADLAPAIGSGLVEYDADRLIFRHPLTPAAIYDLSSADSRRRAHAALATVLVTDRDRRAWHRAASITCPDEAVANELETTAISSLANNRPRMLVEALERAAVLSLDPALRQRRLLRAAECALDVGQRCRAKRLLREIRPDDCSAIDLARVRLVRDMIVAGLIADAYTIDSLIDAAAHAASAGERDLGLRLLRAAAGRSWWAGLAPEVRIGISTAARSVAKGQEDPALMSVLAMSDPEGSNGALRRLALRTPPTAGEPETAFALGTALHFFGAFDRSASYLAEAIPELRRQGRMWLLPEALALQARNGIYVSDLSTAAANAEEAVLLARNLRQPVWEAMGTNTVAIVHALRGETTDAESFLAIAESIAVPIGARAVLTDAQLTRAIIALSAGNYGEAFEHLQRTFDPDDPAHHYLRSAWRLGELAEAAVHAGRVDEARAHLVTVSRIADETAPKRLRMGLVYAGVLLANNDEAETLFEEALDQDLTSWPLYRARLLLQYGMWLRRRRKINQARMPLRAARDSFAALGATVWERRARQELRASREKQHNGPEARYELTDQELLIAEMAAKGLSNRDIGKCLYISPRTVGSHLYRIFPKLGVASRSQLSMALANRQVIEVAS